MARWCWPAVINVMCEKTPTKHKQRQIACKPTDVLAKLSLELRRHDWYEQEHAGALCSGQLGKASAVRIEAAWNHKQCVKICLWITGNGCS